MGPDRHDRFLNSKGLSREETVAKIVAMTDGGADYTSMPATGNTVKRCAPRWSCHRAGHLDHHRRGRGGQGDRDASVPAGHWPQLAAARRSAVPRAAPHVPQIVDMIASGNTHIDPMITHVMGLEEINTAFELMH